MAKKKDEREPEVEVTTAPAKKETFAMAWFRDHAVNNATDLKTICELTARSVYEQFRLAVRSDNTETFAVIFYATFLSILEFIRSKEKTFKNFTMEVMNSVNIGYTNSSDVETEKMGNFMPIMEYIGVNKGIVNDRDDVDDSYTSQSLMRWTEQNAKKTIDYYKEIQEKARKLLQNEYHITLRTSEAVIPIFCIFMDNVANYLKQKYREADGTDVSEISINVFSLFDAYYSYDDENDKEVVEFSPNIMMKLALKDDSAAGHS